MYVNKSKHLRTLFRLERIMYAHMISIWGKQARNNRIAFWKFLLAFS